MQCDFCSSRSIAWRYPAHSFRMLLPEPVMVAGIKIVGQESVSDWAACEFCHALIEANDRDGLRQRSLETLIEEWPVLAEVADEIDDDLRKIHARFFELRCGEATREGSDD